MKKLEQQVCKQDVNPSSNEQQDTLAEAEEKAHQPYRNPWLLLAALALLPGLGFIVGRAPGLLIGFIVGIGLVALYPVLKGK